MKILRSKKGKLIKKSSQSLEISKGEEDSKAEVVTSGKVTS